MAHASSMPGSQSRMTFRGDAGAGCGTLTRAGYRCSAGGVQPANRGAVPGAPERLELVIPGLAEQPGDLVLQAARAVRGPRATHQFRGDGRHCQQGAQAALRDENVAVAHRDRGEDAQIRGVAVTDGVTAGTGLLGDLEPELAPAGQG